MSTALALKYLGHVLDRDFEVSVGVDGERLRWFAATPQPTPAEIAAAEAPALAAEAVEQADAAQWQTDRETLKTQYATAATRLAQIRDTASPTNAQVIAAVRDLAAYQLQILKYIRRL